MKNGTKIKVRIKPGFNRLYPEKIVTGKYYNYEGRDLVILKEGVFQFDKNDLIKIIK